MGLTVGQQVVFENATTQPQTISGPDGTFLDSGAIGDVKKVVTGFTFNLTGLPALSVCTGYGAGGLPVSMQIVGKPFAEATVTTSGLSSTTTVVGTTTATDSTAYSAGYATFTLSETSGDYTNIPSVRLLLAVDDRLEKIQTERAIVLEARGPADAIRKAVGKKIPAEMAKQHELFADWWGKSAVAKLKAATEELTFHAFDEGALVAVEPPCGSIQARLSEGSDE